MTIGKQEPAEYDGLSLSMLIFSQGKTSEH